MKTLWLLPIVFLFWVLFSVVCARGSKDRVPLKVLVFGGNGLLGSSTVDRLIRYGEDVTIVNRGNWYYDSDDRIKPFVKTISCDRKNGIESCEDLVKIVQEKSPFRAVIDFSAYNEQASRDAFKLLKGKADLYIHISTDSVYDLADSMGMEGHVDENAAELPDDPHRLNLVNKYYKYGADKFKAEKVVMEQLNEEGGIPYVIFRLPDVVGPRDNTRRFWMYQLWIKTSDVLKNPVKIPHFLKDHALSFVYSEDVGKKIVDLVQNSRSEVLNDVYNLAWTSTVTLPDFLQAITSNLNLEKPVDFTFDDSSKAVYFYPTVRRGPLNTTKAEQKLGWNPVPWQEAVQETVHFYETAMTEPKFKTQMNEIVQIVVNRFYNDNRTQCFKTLEKLYGIDLAHFWNHKDEL